MFTLPDFFRKYLNSGWCKEEFQLAHLEAVEGRHRFIILIMVDDIPVNDLPDEMQKYVKNIHLHRCHQTEHQTGLGTLQEEAQIRDASESDQELCG